MRYILKKIGSMLLTVLVVSFLSYAAFEMIGDPVASLLGTNASEEAAAALRESLGLNRPLIVRYGEWLLGFFRGDMGTSYVYKLPVSDILGGKLGVTVILTLMGFLLTVAVALPVGKYSARKEGKRIDRILTVTNQILMAVPPFFVAVLLTVIFGLLLKIFTPGSFVAFSESPLRFFGYMLFPAVSIALPRIAMTAKLLRTSILEEMNEDYIRTAYSRGHRRQSAMETHALRNALLPVITFLASTMAEMLAGSIVVEQIFSVPGIGRLLMVSIGNRDIPVVEAIVLILALWVMLVHLLSDILSQLLDPRIRL